jgi:hypothetical protein
MDPVTESQKETAGWWGRDLEVGLKVALSPEAWHTEVLDGSTRQTMAGT